jgi:ketosteroid isomerase-like protein
VQGSPGQIPRERVHLFFLAIAVFTAAVCSCAAGNESAASSSTPVAAAAQAQNENVEQTIRRLENDRSQASLRGDFATLERIVADDFSTVGTSGAVRNKAQWIGDRKSGALKVESQTFADVNVRVYGDAAIITGLMTQKGQDKGKDISGQVRFTRVYVKRNGQWQIVAGHNSRLVQP